MEPPHQIIDALPHADPRLLSLAIWRGGSAGFLLVEVARLSVVVEGDTDDASRSLIELDALLTGFAARDVGFDVTADTIAAEQSIGDVDLLIAELTGSPTLIGIEADTAAAEAGLSSVTELASELSGTDAILLVEADTDAAVSGLEAAQDAAGEVVAAFDDLSGTDAAGALDDAASAAEAAASGLDAVSVAGSDAASGLGDAEQAAAAAGEAVESAGAQAKGFGKHLSGIASLTAGFTLGNAIAAAPGKLLDMAKAAAEDEASMMRLEVAVSNAEGTFDSHAGAIERAISLGQDLAFSDDQVRDALLTLTQQTGDADEAIRRLSLAQDLSRGTGKGLADSARMLGKVTDESHAAFSRLGIQLAKNATAEQVLIEVEKRFGGQAAKFAESTAGEMARAADAVGELQERLGEGLVPALGAASREMMATVDATHAMIDALEDLSDILPASGGDGWLGTIGMHLAIGPALGLADAYQHVGESLEDVTLAIVHGKTEMVAAAAAQEAATVAAVSYTDSMGEQSENVHVAQAAQAALADAYGRQSEAAGIANERNSELTLGLQVGSGAAAQAAFDLDKLSEAADSAWAAQQALTGAWDAATGAVGFWEQNISNAEEALAILSGEQAENGALTAEQQAQYDILTGAVGRYTGGIEDSEGAVVDAAVAQAEMIRQQDDLKVRLDNGTLSAADYASGMADITAETDPATSASYNLSAAQQAVADTVLIAIGQITDLLVQLGLIPSEKHTDVQAVGAVEAKQHMIDLNLEIDNTPTSFTITPQVNLDPFYAGMNEMRDNMPFSPAKEGPLSVEPDWGWLFEGIGPAAQAGVAAAAAAGVDLVAAIGSGALADADIAGANIGERIASRIPDGVRHADTTPAVSAIAEMLHRATNDAINAAHEPLAASGSAIVKALADGVKAEAGTLGASIGLITAEIVPALAAAQQQAQQAFDLGVIAGLDAEDLAKLQADLAAVNEVVRAWGEMTGVTFTEVLDAAAYETQIIDSWTNLLSQIPAIVDGSLTEALLSQQTELQNQLAVALAAGAPEAVIAMLNEQIAANAGQLAQVGELTGILLAEGITAPPVVDAVATAIADMLGMALEDLDLESSGVVDLTSWVDDLISGDAVEHAQQAMDELRAALDYGAAVGWSPEVMAELQAQWEAASIDFYNLAGELGMAAASGLVSEEVMLEWGLATEALVNVPLDRLVTLAGQMADGGTEVVDSLIDGVLSGTVGVEDAFDALVAISDQSLADMVDTNDLAVDDMIATLERLEEQLTVQLAEALIAGTDPAGIEANIAAITALLQQLQAQADATAAAIDYTMDPLNKPQPIGTPNTSGGNVGVVQAVASQAMTGANGASGGGGAGSGALVVTLSAESITAMQAGVQAGAAAGVGSAMSFAVPL